MPPPSADMPSAPVSEEERRAAWRAFFAAKKWEALIASCALFGPMAFALFYTAGGNFPVHIMGIILALPLWATFLNVATEFARFHGILERHTTMEKMKLRFVDHPLFHPQWRYLMPFALLFFPLGYFFIYWTYFG